MNEESKIPKSGRIGRFAKIAEAKIDKEKYLRIMQDSELYSQYNSEQKAIWWKNAVEKLEDETDTKTSIEVMQQCGSKCCGAGQRKTAKKLMSESASLQEFLEKFVNYGVKDGELGYEIINENTFITKHNKCFCGQVKQLKESMKSDVYCQCSVSFNKEFFQAAFNKPVEVKLKQSILTGGDCCEFEIHM